MKKASIILIFLLAGMCVCTSAFAFDFGGTLDNSSKLSTNAFETFGLSQTDSLGLWFRAALNNTGTIYFATEGTAQVEYDADDITALTDGDATWLLDVNLFKLTTIAKPSIGTLQINWGRFFVSDVTGVILSQNSDGMQAVFASERFSLGAYIGYTGILNAKAVSMVYELTAGDDDITGTYPNANYNADALYELASPFIVTGANLSLPYVLFNQTVSAEFYAMIGSGNDRGSNKDIDRYYATLAFNGPIVQNLFYTLSSTLGFVKDRSGAGNLTQATLSYYIPEVKNTALTFSATYASGKNGGIQPFYTFTRNEASYAYTAHLYSGILKAGISASIKPFAALYVAAGADVVCDCAADFGYSGFEWAATMRYQLFSDVLVGLSANQFIAKDKDLNSMVLALNASISF